jgi:hypothetical protein
MSFGLPPWAAACNSVCPEESGTRAKIANRFEKKTIQPIALANNIG